MRMWMLEPRLLCRSHLLGEHRELHAFLGMLNKHNSLYAAIEGLINANLVEVSEVQVRHEVIVVEMLRRGWNHHTPMTKEDFYLAWESIPATLRRGTVDKATSLRVLRERCWPCIQRQNAYLYRYPELDRIPIDLSRDLIDRRL